MRVVEIFPYRNVVLAKDTFIYVSLVLATLEMFLKNWHTTVFSELPSMEM